MGQAALTIVGQGVGFLIGGPIGAAIGGAIGSVIGGHLFAEDQVFEGQRITDLKVQSSAYGQAIPIVYGSVRIAGNLIWASEMRETRIEEDVSQKGGPSATQISYSYDIDVAIALCEGPIVDIERIFANGVLIFDKRAGVDPATVFASGLWATGTYLYPGNDTQLPDPTIEAAVGVGNAQAYRGTAYIVITGLQLNTLKTAQILNFEFVVIQAGTPTQFEQKFIQPDLTEDYKSINFNLSIAHLRVSQGVVRIHGQRAEEEFSAPNGSAQLYDLNGEYVGQNDLTDTESAWPQYVYPDDAPLVGVATTPPIPASTTMTIELGDSTAAADFIQGIIDGDIKKIIVGTNGTGSEDTDHLQKSVRVAAG